MPNPSNPPAAGRRKSSAAAPQVSVEHYLRIIFHRKWLVLGTFFVVTAATCLVVWRMPDLYTSDTLIMVDPQKVPETYVKPTVTGDIRNRLGTLSQQILSATRLQKIIDNLNLYPAERKTMAREDVISKMRSDISVSVVSDFGGSQDLEAFRITYSGRDPRLVAQVANELASQFIDENLKDRETQATGTTDFLTNQLQETRKTLEAQESKLRDFKMRHIGEMPEQQAADLQILGQLQSQLQLEGDALARAEQQKSYLQAMMGQQAPVVDMDETEPRGSSEPGTQKAAARPSQLATLRARLAALELRYTEAYPEVRKVKAQIADEEAKEKSAAETAQVAPPPAAPAPALPAPSQAPAKRPAGAPVTYSNPVLLSQMKSVQDDIAKHTQEKQRLTKLIAGYQAKLEAIPVREQEVTDLVRDYEISKAHYQQLLNNQLSAETATQLEIRQKGEKFKILDPAQPAERPTRPNRKLLDAGGAAAGLGLGLLLALITEFLGMSITAPEQLLETAGVPVLEVIPIIQTRSDQRARRRRLIWGAAASAAAIILACGAVILYQYRT
jgi:polysaccharide chain length determinant protein (PEP-CTERM system associated)